MAACDPNALLTATPKFADLSDEGLRLAQIGATIKWAQIGNPSLDVTPAGILARASCLQCLDETQLKTIIFRKLCAIRGT